MEQLLADNIVEYYIGLPFPLQTCSLLS